MIPNVFGKAVTKSTLISLPEYDSSSQIRAEDLARVALTLKNSQWRGYVERLRDQCPLEDRTGHTLGWIYNATGSVITLVRARNWDGSLASSSLYPIRIENGQWGVFLHKQTSSESSAVVLYEGFSPFLQTCYWSIAWKNHKEFPSAQVHGSIDRYADRNKDGCGWDDVYYKAVGKSGTVHSAKKEGWRSVISDSGGLDFVVFEALLTPEHL